MYKSLYSKNFQSRVMWDILAIIYVCMSSRLKDRKSKMLEDWSGVEDRSGVEEDIVARVKRNRTVFHT
jgi:hypothetical protein